MPSSTTYTVSLHGQQLAGQLWSPPQSPKAVMILVHGHGEHAGRYAAMADFLTQAGIAVVGIDQFGHGNTSGKKGHAPSFAAMLDSIEAQVQEASQRFPGIPLFLYGHSMGGALVTNFVLQRKPHVQGAVLSSPWLRLALKPSNIQLMIGNIAKRLAPALTQPSKLNAEFISQIPEEVARYRQDPLVHDLISSTVFFGVLEAGEFAMAHAAEWPLPLLAYHGSGDKITSHAATQAFAEAVPGDKEFISFEGGQHELHHDLQRQQVLATLRDWILAHAVLQ